MIIIIIIIIIISDIYFELAIYYEQRNQIFVGNSDKWCFSKLFKTKEFVTEIRQRTCHFVKYRKI